MKNVITVITSTVGSVLLAYVLFLAYFALLQTNFAFDISTRFSSKFTWEKWQSVKEGDSYQQVISLLGEPVNKNPRWGCTYPNSHTPNCNGQLWATPIDGYGHFAQVDFINNSVISTYSWKDD